MRISRIQIEQFRNIENLDLKLDQDFIVFVGENGSGKTSVLESIYYVSMLRALPPGKSWELISFGKEYFKIKAVIDDDNYEYYYGKKADKRFVRSQSMNKGRRKASEMVGLVPVVAFVPQDLNLLRLTPSLRRNYLDDVLLQTEPGYDSLLSDFAKVLSNRNELLLRVRDRRSKPSELAVWDEQFIALAARILSARERLIDHINNSLEDLYEQVTGSSQELVLSYVAPYQTGAEPIEDLLFKNREADISSGFTNIGPHRDDWRVEDQQGRNLSRYLSRGEQRSVIISLKLKEHDYLKEMTGKDPLLILDEVLSELDGKRRAQMLDRLPGTTQKFLTTTNIEELPKYEEEIQIIQLSKNK